MLKAGTYTCLEGLVEPLNKGTSFLKYIHIMKVIRYYEKSFH